MADYVLNAYVWNMGRDEADDLAKEIADVLARRGYAFRGEDEEDPMRSIVALCEIDFSDAHDEPLDPEEIFQVISSGSRLLLIPRLDDHEQHRAIGT